MIARIRAALAMHESRAQQQITDTIAAEALSDFDREVDVALGIVR
ncbi:MAG: hypothetical protein M0Z51_11155 [Propionibacterium sp.]|nr:hypothetical protein [Propionibacterium sp.]